MFELEVGRMAFVNSNHVKPDVDIVCSIKFQGNELGRTEPANPAQPVWNEKISLNHFDVNGLESVHNRPFYLEYLTLDVLQKGNKVLETRIPLTCIDKPPTFYKLLRPEGQESKHDKAHEASYLLLSMRSVDEALREWVPCFDRCELRHVLPAQPNLHYLYASMDNTQPSTTYRFGLPGPSCGEQLVDMRRHVEWRIPIQSNAFGDSVAVSCRGNLYISDLRILFLPTDIVFPFHYGHYGQPISFFPESPVPLSEMAQWYLHRFTLQLPISSITDIRTGKVTTTTLSPSTVVETKHILIFETLDGTTLDFCIGSTLPWFPSPLHCAQQRKQTLRRIQRQYQRQHQGQLPLIQGRIVNYRGDSCSTHSKYQDFVYASGLETDDVAGDIWIERVVDGLAYALRRDEQWWLWARHWQTSLRYHLIQTAVTPPPPATAAGAASSSASTPPPAPASTTAARDNPTATWIKASVTALDLDDDYQRCQVQDLHWRLSDLNAAYRLCHSYPASLCFPGSLSDDDILQAATQRSIGRLPAMVWMHPETKAPLCRAAQPLTGVSGLINKEHDKKMCLAIRELCPTRLPLRIADARPKLNANANAMQGKGFENIAYFGGASVASLVFLDIDNIHVMRTASLKVREGLCHIPMSPHGPATVTVSSSTVSSSTSASATNTGPPSMLGSGQSPPMSHHGHHPFHRTLSSTQSTSALSSLNTLPASALASSSNSGGGGGGGGVAPSGFHHTHPVLHSLLDASSHVFPHHGLFRPLHHLYNGAGISTSATNSTMGPEESYANVNCDDPSSVPVTQSRWMAHVASLLRGAVGLADSLCMGHPVLVHCSDGWDRTTQLSALTQLLLDPYYRTIEGFLRLIDKEFSAFGHNGPGVSTIMGSGVVGVTPLSISAAISSASSAAAMAATTTIGFLDCVHQILRQHPMHFEFTEPFLLLLMQALYSGFFVSLRLNCDAERQALVHRYHALWEAERLEHASALAQYPHLRQWYTRDGGGIAMAGMDGFQDDLSSSAASSASGASSSNSLPWIDIINCTSLATYVRGLIRCPGIASRLINPQYRVWMPGTGWRSDIGCGYLGRHLSSAYGGGGGTGGSADEEDWLDDEAAEDDVATGLMGVRYTEGMGGHAYGLLGGYVSSIPGIQQANPAPTSTSTSTFTSASTAAYPMHTPQELLGRRVSYLRIQFTAVHLDLWKEGLFGLNANVLMACHAPPDMTLSEQDLRLYMADRMARVQVYERTQWPASMHAEAGMASSGSHPLSPSRIPNVQQCWERAQDLTYMDTNHGLVPLFAPSYVNLLKAVQATDSKPLMNRVAVSSVVERPSMIQMPTLSAYPPWSSSSSSSSAVVPSAVPMATDMGLSEATRALMCLLYAQWQTGNHLSTSIDRKRSVSSPSMAATATSYGSSKGIKRFNRLHAEYTRSINPRMTYRATVHQRIAVDVVHTVIDDILTGIVERDVRTQFILQSKMRSMQRLNAANAQNHHFFHAPWAASNDGAMGNAHPGDSSRKLSTATSTSSPSTSHTTSTSSSLFHHSHFPSSYDGGSTNHSGDGGGYPTSGTSPSNSSKKPGFFSSILRTFTAAGATASGATRRPSQEASSAASLAASNATYLASSSYHAHSNMIGRRPGSVNLSKSARSASIGGPTPLAASTSTAHRKPSTDTGVGGGGTHHPMTSDAETHGLPMAPVEGSAAILDLGEDSDDEDGA
eukprot:gene10449-7428_t